MQNPVRLMGSGGIVMRNKPIIIHVLEFKTKIRYLKPTNSSALMLQRNIHDRKPSLHFDRDTRVPHGVVELNPLHRHKIAANNRI